MTNDRYRPLFASLLFASAMALPLVADDYVKCPALEQPMLKVPEITRDAATKTLQAVMTVSDQERLVAFNTTANPPSIYCASQHLRFFSGYSPVHKNETWPVPNGLAEPLPGPTLRARVGDIVEITFLNQVDLKQLPGSQYWDRDQCDNVPGVYPSNAPGGAINDKFPNCFHGSSTANIHFHGTHTNPNSTGDNVLLQIRPSPRTSGGGPEVTEATVHDQFEKFFADCRTNLAKVPRQWPFVWENLPEGYRKDQKRLIDEYDAKNPTQMLWHHNQMAIDAMQWPQYFIGAYPTCYQLPEYEKAPEKNGDLHMGQAPGTMWYHMHKHGSTTLNIANGLVGAMIIEGKYDDQLNDFYKSTDTHKRWDLKQQVLVIQEVGVLPNLMRKQTAPPLFSVNGRRGAVISMKPGEVQMWRIVNGSPRSGAYFVGGALDFPDGKRSGVQWVQIAQDGVQLHPDNYIPPADGKPSAGFLMASGNRVDLLVRVPKGTPAGKIPIQVVNVVKPTEEPGGSSPNPAVTLFYVNVEKAEAAKDPEPGMDFITTKEFPTFPEFLGDIDPATIHVHRTLTFNSTGFGAGANHTINGAKFGDQISEVMLLNSAEEWKIVNTTSDAASPGPIMHPFHIHINPFQIVEFFNPYDPRYVFDQTNYDPNKVCNIQTADPSTWHPCKVTALKPPFVWWDTFSMPGGREVHGVVIPGYFTFRSNFNDYTGQYVLHCHILAHEDRGMMELIEVVPNESIWQHH
jgi:FtsP/CotA-like multicopper oxidase with cupredoxin domain